MDAKLRTSWWSLMGSLDDLGDDYVCDAQTLATVMLAKRQAVVSAIRDVRAGTFHPLTPEATLTYAGKVALGDPGATE